MISNINPADCLYRSSSIYLLYRSAAGISNSSEYSRYPIAV